MVLIESLSYSSIFCPGHMNFEFLCARTFQSTSSKMGTQTSLKLLHNLNGKQSIGPKLHLPRTTRDFSTWLWLPGSWSGSQDGFPDVSATRKVGDKNFSFPVFDVKVKMFSFFLQNPDHGYFA